MPYSFFSSFKFGTICVSSAFGVRDKGERDHVAAH